MTLHKRKNIIFLAAAILYATAAHGSTIYDERVSGDLSNSGLAPTLVTVSVGSNYLFGTTGKTNNVIDRDYFKFVVPQAEELTAITVLPGTQTLGTLGDSFIGIESGPQVTVSTSATDATGLLGWFHYDTGDIGGNILPFMGMSGFGSTGFTAPLPAGTYSFWEQEASTGTVPYGLDFTVATPEPASWTMLLAGLMLLVGRNAFTRTDRVSTTQAEAIERDRKLSTGRVPEPVSNTDRFLSDFCKMGQAEAPTTGCGPWLVRRS